MDQMASPSLCLFRSPLPWIAVFLPLLIICGLLGFGYLSISLLTALILVISTVYFTFSKQKPLAVEKIEKEETPKSENNSSLPQMEEVLSKLQAENDTSVNKMDEYSIRSKSLSEMEGNSSNLQPGREITTEKKEDQEGGMSQIHENTVIRSPDLLSESGSVEESSTSDDSEIDWTFQDNVNQSSVCSDGSISDEDSLIEISLPTGHYVSCNEEEPRFNLQQKMPDFMAKSIFKQHSKSLMEVLAEMNEENLIEIDISMGSIKCSRFEIEA